MSHPPTSSALSPQLVRRLLCDRKTGRGDATGAPEAGGTAGYAGYAFPPVFSRLGERIRELSREREQLPGLVERIRSLPEEELRQLLLADPELQTWALCEWLIEECRDLTHAETVRAEALADLAVSLVERLAPERYGEPLVNDLRARSWTCAGEVLRNLADLRAAEEALARADDFLARGTGDDLEEAGLLEATAALLRDRQKTPEAHRLIDEAIDIYRRYRDLHLVGRAFVQKGTTCAAAQDLDAAIRWFRKGLGLLDSTRERRLELSARLSLMLSLHESGHHHEAWFLLKASRSEIQSHGGELLRLRLVWLEGKIQLALGAPGDAERSLAEACQGFAAQGVGFDAAAASLDLALLYAAQGRSGEMRRLAEEMLAISAARDLHREALAALIVFQQAVRMDRASAELLLEIRTYLQRARKDPTLRFEASF
jgi:tetratricopeptide (TPR) repeat protein